MNAAALEEVILLRLTGELVFPQEGTSQTLINLGASSQQPPFISGVRLIVDSLGIGLLWGIRNQGQMATQCVSFICFCPNYTLQQGNCIGQGLRTLTFSGKGTKVLLLEKQVVRKPKQPSSLFLCFAWICLAYLCKQLVLCKNWAQQSFNIMLLSTSSF